VHVVYTFSESVTLTDARNQSNGVISEAFTLRFWNTSGSNAAKWDDLLDLAHKTEVLVNTTGKTITVALSSLSDNTKYQVKFNDGVITDFAETASATVWGQISTSLDGYEFTTVGSVTDESKPKVVASYVTPLSDDKVILGANEATEVMVVFDRPLDEAEEPEIAADCVTSFGSRAPQCDTTAELDAEGDVLKVTVPSTEADGPDSGETPWNLKVAGAASGSNFVNKTAMQPALVVLSKASPTDTGSTYDKFSDDSTVVLEFSDAIQAGTAGTITLEAQQDPANTLTFSVDDPAVSFVGKFLVIETSDLMAGEQFQVSMENATVKGVTTATLGRSVEQTAAYVPSANQFATVPKISFEALSLSFDAGAPGAPWDTTVAVSGAGVAFGPDNSLYVIGGMRDGQLSNKTFVSETYRDTDTAKGFAMPSRCTDPCAGLPQTVTDTVYGAASSRGLRWLSSTNVAHSVQGAALEETEGNNCECPVCIDEPGVREGATKVPEHGYFFHGGNTVYTQVNAMAAGLPLTCDVGVTDANPLLKATQGYEDTDVFLCTVGDTTNPAEPTAEYFGVWKIEETACAPKPCLMAPEFPAEMFAGSDAACNAFKVTGANGTTTFDMEHDENCTVSCNAGYKRDGLFKCDRGIFIEEELLKCTARTCEHDLVENGELSAKTVNYKESITVTCNAGYQAVGESSIECTAVTAVAESLVELAGNPLSCEKRECAAEPTVNNADSVVCAGTQYMDKCEVTCAAGHYFTDGTEGQAQAGAVTCDGKPAVGGAVAWSGVPACEPVKCDTADASFSNARASGTVSGLVGYGETYALVCNSGYSTDAADETAATFVAQCGTDDAYASVIAADKSCVPLDCAKLDDISGGQTINVGSCDAETPLAAGTECEFQCSSGQLANADFTRVTCLEGVLNMCTGDSCASGDMSPVSKDSPACVAAGAKVQAKEVLRSAATIGLSGSAARRLATKAELEAQIDGVLVAFEKAMATTLDVSPEKVVVEGHTLTENDDGSLNLVIQFYVEVEAGTESDALSATLTEFAEGGGDLGNDLMTAFQAELQSVEGVTIVVSGVSISAPQKTTIYVAEPTPEGGDGDDDEGGGGGAVVIVVVVIVVLAVVGLVVYKFVLKK